jgi:hypothetical protein
VFILKVVKVLCFETLSQVFILNGLLAQRFPSLDLELYLKNLGKKTGVTRQFLDKVGKVLMAEPVQAQCAQIER